ncbi:hypothetical protein [Soonwooa sp.]|uniref:hypothetical protein n=1 Tax=Soonwooa sp. TaxID=1938592 RepID=UPI00261A4F63|nr:hypothetical protein [Soonwooa sp.]
MKKLAIFIISLFIISCSTQIKLNKGTDVDFIEMQPALPDGKFLIKNNTSNTYIIDPRGFWGTLTYFENDKLAPLIPFPEGTFYRYSKEQCEEGYIILKPHEKIEANFLLSRDFSGTDLDPSKVTIKNKYYYVIKSKHDKFTILGSACDDYLLKLEQQGYRILEDSISARIAFVPRSLLRKK